MRKSLRTILVTVLASLPLAARAHPAPETPQPSVKAEKNPEAATLEEKLLGKWKVINAEDEMEFRKDGTFTAGNSQITMSGNFWVRDDLRLEMDIGLRRALKGNLIREIEMKDESLILTDPKSKQSVTYNRVK